MKNLFQIIILSLTVNLFLTACSEQQRQDLTQKIKQKQIENAIKKLPTHNEQMPEYPQIKPPSELSNEQIDKNVQFVTTQIVHHENRIIYYSKVEKADGDREVIENKADSEYYRTILGTTQDGNCAIQDFYSENDKKQIEPMIVKKDECESWKAQPFDGMAVWYDKNGKVELQTGGVIWLKHGEPVAVLSEKADQGLSYIEFNVRPNVRHTVFVSTKTPNQGERPHAIECELNEKENKIEKFILFTKNNMVEKVSFNDNKIDPNRLIAWTADAYGFIDTVNKDKMDELQKLALAFCGVTEQSLDKAE